LPLYLKLSLLSGIFDYYADIFIIGFHNHRFLSDRFGKIPESGVVSDIIRNENTAGPQMFP